jgi:subtilisin family serine protease
VSNNSGVAATPAPVRCVPAVLAVTALLAASLSAGAPAAGAPAQGAPTDFAAGRYIVTLEDPAVSGYEGGIGGYAATAPDEGEQLDASRAPARDYSDLLAQRQTAVADAAGVGIDVSYTMAINGFSATLSPAQAAELSADPAVAHVTPDEIVHPAATPAPAFLGLDGENGVWQAIGGVENAGRGTVIGVLDTGIAPENPAFAGRPLGTAPGPEPYLAADGVITFLKGDGDTFSGYCEEGEQFPADSCSTKIVGARSYLSDRSLPRGDASVGEYDSPRDGSGHGSHTASVAAGDAGVAAAVRDRDFGAISGIAPAARIAAYKVCWSGPDPLVTSDDGCSTTDILAAINQAVKDSVDVLNYSIGGPPAQTTYSPTGAAFLGAASAGIFVTASAGNSGPASSTLDNAAPWITTVAASTIPSYYGTVTLGDGQTVVGGSISVTAPVTGPLVTAAAVAAAGADPAKVALCYPNTLDASRLPAGAIVVCDRGVIDRNAKSSEVKRAGGIAMVLTNLGPGSLDEDAHSIPTVNVDAAFRDQIRSYAATPGATATLTAGGTEPPSPQVAPFSSRGPVLADGGDILKPDLTAPGVAILAAGANAAGGTPSFEFLSGTSMASPHVAGLAALYLGERPAATPGEVKSAMMTTARDTVDSDGAATHDPFAQGAGQVDPTEFFDPGLLYLNGPEDWRAYLQGIGYDLGVQPVDASDLNLPSIAVGTLASSQTVTRRVTSTGAGEFTASIEGLAGISAVVQPPVLAFAAAGETRSFTVTLTRTDAPLDAFATGSLLWTSGDTVVRSPVAVRPAALAAPGSVEGTGESGSVAVTVTPKGDGAIPLTTSGLTRAVLLDDPSGALPDHSGQGGAGESVSYRTTVAPGAELARFDLDGLDPRTDLDLSVYQLDAAGQRVAGWESATVEADERVDLTAPVAADYEVVVTVATASQTASWDLAVAAVLPGGSPLVLDPPVLAGLEGVDSTFTASWAGLPPRSTWVGLVGYGDSGVSTVVQVETGGELPPPEPVPPVNLAQPSIVGSPRAGSTLVAEPGEWDGLGLRFSYQWRANGTAIAGATGPGYEVASGDAGAVITVEVSAGLGDGPRASAVSEGVTVVFASSTTIALDRNAARPGQAVLATVTVASAAPSAPTGTVTVLVNGRSVPVALGAAERGRVVVRLPALPSGIWGVSAVYSGDAAVDGSRSAATPIWMFS